MAVNHSFQCDIVVIARTRAEAQALLFKNLRSKKDDEQFGVIALNVLDGIGD